MKLYGWIYLALVGIAIFTALILALTKTCRRIENQKSNSNLANEMVCDYIACELLLPKKELRNQLNSKNYDNLHRSDKLKIIKQIADERQIPESVVINQILMLRRSTS